MREFVRMCRRGNHLTRKFEGVSISYHERKRQAIRNPRKVKKRENAGRFKEV